RETQKQRDNRVLAIDGKHGLAPSREKQTPCKEQQTCQPHLTNDLEMAAANHGSCSGTRQSSGGARSLATSATFVRQDFIASLPMSHLECRVVSIQDQPHAAQVRSGIAW